MTDPQRPTRNAAPPGWAERGALLLILAVTTGLRLHGVAFGLPSLNDPDEPLFVMTAIDMIRSHTLDPHWFGHPGTITLYCLVLVILAIGGIGIATGHFADTAALVSAAYADPGILVLPARLFIVLCGVICVYLTYRLGRQLGDARMGLLAAAFLAVNALHIELSQIVRTDMQASVFMLLCALASIAVIRHGRVRDYALAGLWVGLACATKWPAAIVVLSPVCASLYRIRRGHAEARRLALLGIFAILALFAASPFLLIDHSTVLRDLMGEKRPIHPGATGHGFIANVGWYFAHPFRNSFGLLGLALALFGTIRAFRREAEFGIAVLPGFVAFFLVLSAQSLIWARWMVPVLPALALAAAYACCTAFDALRKWTGRALPKVETAALLLAFPMITAATASATERMNDTRQVADQWIRRHVAPGRSILIEDAAFDILWGPWHFLFPLGSAGCIDARGVIQGHIRYDQPETYRSGRAVVDLGHVDDAKLATCRADYAILTHYNVYRSQPALFGAEVQRYWAWLRHGRVVAVIRPIPGRRGGPVVYIVRRAG
jgi:hypothetical protein